MGLALNRITEGAVDWFSQADGNLSTLEGDFVARQHSDTSIVTVSGTTAETALMANATIPANALGVGKVIRPWAAGTVTIPALSTPTVTWRLRWGGISGTIIASWGFNFGSSGSQYTVPWILEQLMAGVSEGASGTTETDGWIMVSGTFIAGVSTGVVTLDTTTSKVLLWTVQSTLSTVSVSQRLWKVNRG